MKLSAIAAVAAGVASVSAVPLRVVVIPPPPSSLPEEVGFAPNVPFPPAVATIIGTQANQVEGRPGHGMRRPCGGRGPAGRFRAGALKISNAFRHALGLPTIDTDPHAGITSDGRHYINWKTGPFPFPHTHHDGGRDRHESPPFIQAIPGTKNGWITVTRIGDPNLPPSLPPHHHQHIHHRPGGPDHFRSEDLMFNTLLHSSSMNSGRWQGRAVAFVLGCGVGVLLRMFWVLAVVTYRAFKGRREDEHEYTHVTIIQEYDDEAVLLPPTYVYPLDEKAALEPEATKPAEESK